MLVSGGVGGGGGAGGVEDGVGVVVGVCVGVWSTWERVSPLATVDEGSGGGVGATFITDGRLLLVLSLFEGLSAAGKMIWGYWEAREEIWLICLGMSEGMVECFYAEKEIL